MKLYVLPLFALTLFASATPLLADAVPYPNVGTTAPTVDVFAASHGITVYFDGSNAGYDNFVSVSDPTTGYNSGEFFEGHATTVGASLTLGTGALGTSASIDPGDQLVFYIESGDGHTYASLPGDSADGVNHVYITSFSGDSVIPAGTYAGFEDSYVPGADRDYNDDSLVFTGIIATSATPEPSSLVLLGTGLLSACGVARRKLRRS